MPTTFAAQLAALELGHVALATVPHALSAQAPDRDAATQTLHAVWSDLFALFPDTVLEDDAEELGWAFVNLFHRAADKRSRQLDRATDEVRCLLATADGSEIQSVELESEIAKAQYAEKAMLALEELREIAAGLYLQESGRSWRPASGSRTSHGDRLTSAVIDGREFLRARAASQRRAVMPEGTPVVFSGGRLSFADSDAASRFAANLWETLDRVREHVADLVLVHGGDGKGADRLAASWAEQRRVPQVTFGLDPRLGQRAGFKRNEQMLALKPRYVIAFPGNGVVERLVIDAKRLGLAVVDRRGPLGTNPKYHARVASG